MIIALASPRVATSLDDGLANIARLTADAARQKAGIVCFPEAYLPGLRGQDFEVFPFGPGDEERALLELAECARAHGIAMIASMERIARAGRQIAAYVFGADGQPHGYQTKNQLDPGEDQFYVPGDTRQIFEVNAEQDRGHERHKRIHSTWTPHHEQWVPRNIQDFDSAPDLLVRPVNDAATDDIG